jgi:hypothetical protein
MRATDKKRARKRERSLGCMLLCDVCIDGAFILRALLFLNFAGKISV